MKTPAIPRFFDTALHAITGSNCMAGLVAAIAILILSSGCSTSFKYTPAHENSYLLSTNRLGLAITTGQDLRPDNAIRPDWTRNAESIVSHALADEAKHAKMFRRVGIHADSAASTKYSEIVRFRIVKFEIRNQSGFLESAGKEILRYKGFRGGLIADSIPTKYISEVEIEFEVLDAATQRSLFRKSYAATREDKFNGYQNETLKIRLTSAALESVITDFVKDLAKPPASPKTL